MDQVDWPDAEKSEWIKLEFLMDPDNPALDSKITACGVNIVTRITTARLISELLSNSNIRNRLALKPKLEPERIFLPFLKKSMHSKRS
jgi:hypothetical protein